MIAGTDPETARQAANLHVRAVATIVSASADAGLERDNETARRHAFAANRLTGELAGLWGERSWQPMFHAA